MSTQNNCVSTSNVMFGRFTVERVAANGKLPSPKLGTATVT